MPDNYEVYYFGTSDSPMSLEEWLQSLLDDNRELVSFSEGWWVFRKIYPLSPENEGCTEVHWDCKIAQLEKEIARLQEKLHDEMSQLEIATDLGNKRWVALNEIYENGEKHNANWCKRKAQEGLGIK